MHDPETPQHNRSRGADDGPTSVDWRFEGSNGFGAAIMEMPELIQAARGGDERAFNHLISHYQAAAQRLAQQILRTEEAAADAVQDALIKVHRALPRFQDGNFRSWLLRIVTNTCYDYLRSQRRRSTVSLDDLTEPSGAEFPQLRADELQNPEMLVTQQESLQFLLQAIEELPQLASRCRSARRCAWL